MGMEDRNRVAAVATRRRVWLRGALAVALFLTVVSLLWLWSYAGCQDRSVSWELARRTACQGHLVEIYRAIMLFQEREGGIPKTLEHLVEAGLLEERSLVCPSGAAKSLGRHAWYRYFPGNWGSMTDPIVTEDAGNHSLMDGTGSPEGGRARSISGACYELWSEGTVRNSVTGRSVRIPDVAG